MSQQIESLNSKKEKQSSRIGKIERFYLDRRLMITGIPEQYGEPESRTLAMTCELFLKILQIPCGNRFFETTIDRITRVGTGKNRSDP